MQLVGFCLGFKVRIQDLGWNSKGVAYYEDPVYGVRLVLP